MSQPIFQPELLHVIERGQTYGPYPYAEVLAMVRNGQATRFAMVAMPGGSPYPITQLPGAYSRRNWVVALVLSILLGELGIDRFYMGRFGLGLLKLITVGGLGIWWLIDIILVASRSMRDDQGLTLA